MQIVKASYGEKLLLLSFESVKTFRAELRVLVFADKDFVIRDTVIKYMVITIKVKEKFT